MEKSSGEACEAEERIMRDLAEKRNKLPILLRKGNPCLNLAVVCQLQEHLSGGTVYLHLSKVVRGGTLSGSDLGR